MTDGNTHAIAQHLDERDEWDALQEVTVELEQAEARIEELEAKLAKAIALAEEALEFNSDGDDYIEWSSIWERIKELKGETDE